MKRLPKKQTTSNKANKSQHFILNIQSVSSLASKKNSNIPLSVAEVIVFIRKFMFYKLFYILFFFTSASLEAAEWQNFIGKQNITDNTLFDNQDGYGIKYSSRFYIYPGSQDFLALGLSYTQTDYELESSNDTSGVSTTGKGSFTEKSYGPSILITTPLPWSFKPYLHVGYKFGEYTYKLSKLSTQTSADSQSIESTFNSKLTSKSNGFEGGLGFKIGGLYNFFMEWTHSYENLLIKEIDIAAYDKIDGERQKTMASDSGLEESFSGLVGKRYNHTTRTISMGLGLSF